MAEEKKKGALQKIVGFLTDVLEYAANLLNDDGLREEYLISMGLDPSKKANIGSFSEAKKFYDSEEGKATLLAYKAAWEQLVAAYHNIRDFADQFGDAANKKEIASDIVTSLLNLATTEVVRTKYPKFHGWMTILRTADHLAQQGGGSGFLPFILWNQIAEAFGLGKEDLLLDGKPVLENGEPKQKDRVFLEDDAAAQTFTDFLSVTLMGGLGFLSGKVLKAGKFFDNGPLFTNFSFQGSPGSDTPAGDRAGGSSLSFAVFLDPLDVASNVFLSLGFLPKTSALGDGAYATLRYNGAAADLPLNDKWAWSVSGKANIDALFSERGGNFFGSSDKSFRIVFTRKKDKPSVATLLTDPHIAFGIGTYSFGLELNEIDGIQLRIEADLYYALGSGNNSSFPLTQLPAGQQEGNLKKVHIPLVASLKRKKIYFEGGSTVQPSESKNTASQSRNALAPRDGAAPPDAGNLLSLLHLQLPTDVTLGPVTLMSLFLGLSSNDEGLIAETSFDLRLRFGKPVTMVFNRLGFEMNLKEDDENGAFLGYDIQPSFKLPTGAGIVVDADVVKGGGFLYLDPDRGEYYGSLELEFKDLFTLKAIGILQTKNPDGTKGFSLLIIVTGEFTPVQLGFGFTLMGVGGLLGLNRGLRPQVLQEGLKSNLLRNILFPKDPVANITRIVSDLQQVFPAEKGTFLVGIMGRFGWGTPTLVTIDLGIILTLPSPTVNLIGSIRSIQPSEDHKILIIQANLFGRLDFRGKYVFFRAELFDSFVAGFKITGGLVFYVGWGNDDSSGFVLSVGGFHRDFTQLPTVPGLPNAFKGLDRVRFTMLDEKAGDPASLWVECYFALTSNAVMIGAAAHLYVDGPWGSWLKGELSFDALIYFDPFRFQFDLYASVKIGYGDSTYGGITLKGRLTGPRPWEIDASATLDLWLFDLDIPVHAKWGNPTPATLGGSEDLMQVLEREVQDDRNWRVEMPAGIHQHVSLAGPPIDGSATETTETPLHPAGMLVFSQRSLPLNRPVSRFGNKKPVTSGVFKIGNIKTGAKTWNNQPAQERFAPAQFFELSEKEKLTRRSFEAMDSGLQLSDSAALLTAFPVVKPKKVGYELIYTPEPPPPPNVKRPTAKMNEVQMRRFGRQAAVSKSALSSKPMRAKITVIAFAFTPPPGFAIAAINDLRVFREGSPENQGYIAPDRTQGQMLLDQLLDARPELSGQLQVVESFEAVWN